MNAFIRTRMLIGNDAEARLRNSNIIIFGIGGVGSYTAEALARCGIGHITLVDDDIVSESNINRQLIALHSTIGLPKTEVMKRRIADINPSAEVTALNKFYLPENAGDFELFKYDYVIDAVDTVSAKLDIAERTYTYGIPAISSMGAGNKLHPEMFEIDDIFNTSMCPLARVMRRELKKREVKKLTVVYSKEKALTPTEIFEENKHQKRQIPGSISFVPSAAGLMIAGKVVRDIIT